MGLNALILGAYGGIGSVLSHRLKANGARLVLSGRDEEKLNILAKELGVDAFPADASNFDAVDNVVERAVESLGTIDGAVNCSGSLLLKPAHLTKFEEFRSTVDASLTSSFALVRSVARPMMKSKAGSVVLVSTAAAAHGLPNHEAIAAAKGGVDALVRSAAATYGKSGVRVNAVAPGFVLTGMTSRGRDEEGLNRRIDQVPLKRMSGEFDMAYTVAFLASDEADFITGQVISPNGGERIVGI